MEADSSPLRRLIFTSFNSGSTILYIGIILLLIALSALFAAFETSYSFLNKTRVESKADEGDKKSKRILKVLAKNDKIIVSILIFINIFHILSSTLATVLLVNLMGEIGSVIATIVMTILVFMFAETLPKNIAKYSPDKVFYNFFDIFMLLTYLIYPIVFIFSLPYKLIKKNEEDDEGYSEEELSTIVDSLEAEETLEEDESALIQSAMDFDDTATKEIFTPLSKVYSLDANIEKEELIKELTKPNCHKRIPVYKTSKDNIVGFIKSRNALKRIFKEEDVEVRDLIFDIEEVKQTSKLDDLFDTLVDNKTHIAVVKDKTNQTIGIVTLNDCLKELISDYMEVGDNNE